MRRGRNNNTNNYKQQLPLVASIEVAKKIGMQLKNPILIRDIKTTPQMLLIICKNIILTLIVHGA